MRYTPLFLILLGVFLLATSIFSVGVAVTSGYAEARHQQAIRAIETNMSESEIVRVFGLKRPAADRHRELDFRLGGSSAGEYIAWLLVVQPILGVTVLVWGIAEKRVRQRIALKAAMPIMGGKCRQCGYARNGINSATRCPECGLNPSALLPDA